MEYEILTSLRCRLAEGPLYHPDDNSVYWTDIDSGRLHRHDLDTLETETVHTGSPIGGFTLQEDGNLLLFRESGAVHLLADGEIVEFIAQIPDEVSTRFNDVSADPAGRVFCGTMPTKDRKGRLYRLDHDGTIQIVLEEVGCSNGMGWSPDLKTMYFTDTGDGAIYKFDYDLETGEMSNRRVLYRHSGDGAPDGMTVDEDGNIWTALWGGCSVIKVSSDGEVIERVTLPARNITCPAFGGADLDELYVTAAGGHEPERGDGAGELMRVRPGVKGKTEFRSKIRVGANS